MKDSDSIDPPEQCVGAVILAAGQGTRMRSALPKVLHPVAGRPMLLHVAHLARVLGCQPIVAVVGHQAEQVRQAAGDSLAFVEQSPQLGTGHAVAQARPALADRVERVLVLYGDAPLATAETLRSLLQAGAGRALALLTAELSNPRGYGRIVRAEGRVVGLVEEAEASEAIRAIGEVFSGVLCAEAPWLWTHLATLQPHPNGEFYLTDLVRMAALEGLPIGAVQPAQPEEIMGINDRAQLAQANQVLWERKRRDLMAAGVTLLDPGSTFVDAEVLVGQDTIIHPNTYLRGRTVVGQGCELGPGTLIQDSQLGDRCRVVMSVVEGAELAERVQVGPFAHLRPGARIEADVELGNFSEVKASVVGAGSKAHHFSYLGDAVLGKNVNVGAGTITCNYDGVRKHRTVVGDNVFIGSDTMLVAPVALGDGARTGAGAVVTRDVAPEQLVVGVPARPVPGKGKQADAKETEPRGQP
ncbi:MAG: bifunctional UDP-N-acetylglucosamine diphosphorylase/glucosamine-1-phosphate N-acetyltransferase GlmU [Chloroflexi bacterium]|nr:bifunctional UDP-N-acetylglucosamine diphosphorylase/glucosamine-1-phosphate N-acetyltransferase GlmU [Chloroflexota bacterium]